MEALSILDVLSNYRMSFFIDINTSETNKICKHVINFQMICSSTWHRVTKSFFIIIIDEFAIRLLIAP